MDQYTIINLETIQPVATPKSISPSTKVNTVTAMHDEKQPQHADPDHDKSTSYIPISLTVTDLYYEVNEKQPLKEADKRQLFKRRPTVQRALLSNITIKAAPGRVLAILGPSSSGKTTLLDLIVDRLVPKQGQIRGKIRLNKISIKYHGDVVQRLVGYVTRKDDFVETLTVLETLTFAAKLKLPRGMCHADKMARVCSVMKELDLTDIQNTTVGGPFCTGITGGERRRLTIGIELLSSPSVLLLDEPTSGLSSTDALNVAQVIKDLAVKGRTVLMTVHQPRSDIYELFDDLLLMAEGKIAYFGKANTAAEYFRVLGHPCPPNWNVADFLLNLIEHPQNPSSTSRSSTSSRSSSSVNDFLQIYNDFVGNDPTSYWSQIQQDNRHNQDSDQDHASLSSIEKRKERAQFLERFKGESSSGHVATTMTQVWVLTHRDLVHLFRHPGIFWVSLGVFVILGLVMGSLFFRMKDTRSASGVVGTVVGFNKATALYFIVSLLGIMTFAAMPRLIFERSLFLRERSSGMYRTSSYFIAKTLVETLSYTILSVVYMMIVYYLMGLEGSLLYYLIVTALCTNVSLSIVSAISAGASTYKAGLKYLALVFGTSVIFSGFVITRPEIPRGWIWAYWISYYQWSYSGLMLNEFKSAIVWISSVSSSSTSSVQGVGATTLHYFGMGEGEMVWLTKWGAVWILVGYYVVLRMVGFVALLKKK